MDQNNVPTLRFTVSSEEWKSQKIKQVTSYVDYRGKTPTKSDEGTFLVTAKNVKQGYIDYESSKEYVPSESYREVMRRGKPVIGDVLITTEAPLGNVASIDREDIALAQRIIKLRGKENVIDNGYLKYCLSSYEFQKSLIEKSTGSTAKGIKGSVLHEMAISYPSLPEQQKIASFLAAIDAKIELLTKKKAILEQYKKGVMQQLFSQQIRFKDDEGNEFLEWEEKKLEQIGAVTGGGTPDTAIEKYWNGGVQWFTPTELKTKYVNESIRTISTAGVKASSSKLLPKGTVLFSSRATVGDVSIALRECTTNQGFQSIITNESSYNEFIYYWLSNNKKTFLRKASGSTFLEINKTEFSKIKINLPSLLEQEKIADFLKTVDLKIDTICSQIKKTDLFKKGLLQQLFV